MGKLPINTNAGFNAGQNYYAKMVRVSDIVIDPEISQAFQIQDKTLEGIIDSMLKLGYDKSQPVVLQKGTNIILDGHTRLKAAKETGLAEIPAVEKEFESREDAILYTFERQALRRNLSGAEILAAAKMLGVRKEKDGKGRAAEILAGKLGIGKTTMYQARAVIQHGDSETIQAVKDGTMSVKKAYSETAKNEAKKQPGKTPSANRDIHINPGSIAKERFEDFLSKKLGLSSVTEIWECYTFLLGQVISRPLESNVYDNPEYQKDVELAKELSKKGVLH